MKLLIMSALSLQLSAAPPAMATDPDYDTLIADIKARIELVDKEDGKQRIALSPHQKARITVASIRADSDYTSADPDRYQNMLELSTYCWQNVDNLDLIHHVLFCLSYDINVYTQSQEGEGSAEFQFHFYPGETSMRAERALEQRNETQRVKHWYNAVVRTLWEDMVFQLESEKKLLERERAN